MYISAENRIGEAEGTENIPLLVLPLSDNKLAKIIVGSVRTPAHRTNLQVI